MVLDSPPLFQRREEETGRGKRKTSSSLFLFLRRDRRSGEASERESKGKTAAAAEIFFPSSQFLSLSLFTSFLLFLFSYFTPFSPFFFETAREMVFFASKVR